MDQTSTSRQKRVIHRFFQGIGLRVILVVLAILAIWIGVPRENGLRRWVFEETKPIRFREDAKRGFAWGKASLDVGYFNLYDKFKYDPVNDRENWLDYAPLRLGVMTFWAKYNSYRFPHENEFQNNFEFTAPVLWFNTSIELVAAVGMFCLTRHWIRRRQSGLHPVMPNAGLIGGFIAAMLLWFSPAALISAHGWPTWDVWVAAFFIWAVYLACRDCWFWAGVIIAIGALFKGQQLAVAILFLIWPMAAGAPKRILNLSLLAIVLLLIRIIDTPGWTGFIAGWGLLITILVMAYDVIRFGHWFNVLKWVSGFVSAIALIVSVWMLRRIDGSINWLAILWMLIPIASGIALWKFFPVTRQRYYIHALIFGIFLLLCMPIFGASSNWFEYGWRFGTTHFDQLIVGLPNNFPALLTKRFGFYNSPEAASEVIFTIPKGLQFGFPFSRIDVTLRLLMQSIFVLMMIPCAIAAADHVRRNDARFLVAICTPWLLFYMFPLQIHERYLLFFAMASACFVAVSTGMTLLHLLITAFSWAVTMNILLNPSRRAAYAGENPTSIFITYGDSIREYCNSLHPDSAWAILLITLICFYYAVTRSRPDRAILPMPVEVKEQIEPAIPEPAPVN